MEDPELVRLYLAWDGPDRYQSDFTMAGYEAFRDRVAPILAGQATGYPLPAPLDAANLTRGLEALRPAGFDPALAARCLLASLGSLPQPPQAVQLRAALAGTAG